LDGGLGADTLIGGSGNDTYIVRNYEGGTSILIQSSPGDPIGNGQTYSLAPKPGDFGVTLGDGNHDGLIDAIRLTYIGYSGTGQYWELFFSAPQAGGNLLPGTYTGAQISASADHPGLSITSNNSTSQICGNFTINDATFDYSGPSPVLLHLSIDFEQHSGSATAPPLFGTITYDKNTPLGIVTVDTVVENPREGIDTVQAWTDYTLPANVENLVLNGTVKLNGTGNASDNSISGNSGANVLDGGAGADTISGGAGGDTLLGSAGNDSLIGGINFDQLDGGSGDDTLFGGGGSDIFVFSSLNDLSANGDHIVDFDGLFNMDSIDLSRIAGLHFIGTAAFTGSAGEVRYIPGVPTTSILIDVNGDGISDKKIVLDNGYFPLVESSPGSNILHAVQSFSIEAFGTTVLAKTGNNFSLHDNGGINLPLTYQGSNVSAGQFGAWTPIGAEKTGNGYEIAWKFGNADQYMVWSTDANGNYISTLISGVPGSDLALQSSETLFQQDLNGDGHIGLVQVVIENKGATTLATTSANLFYLEDNQSAGPVLKYQGANVTAGQFGAWTPIGAEATGTGYEVAWKFGSADQYIVWTTDANGNYLSSPLLDVPGSDPALESAETLFQQDLNGDGHLGVVPPAIGLTINVSYDSSVDTAPAGFKAAVQSVIQYYEDTFADPITMNIAVGYGEVGGTPMGAGPLGNSVSVHDYSTFGDLTAALAANATSSADAQTVATFTQNPFPGNQVMVLSQAEMKVLGLEPSDSVQAFDGYIGISNAHNFDFNGSDGISAGTYDFASVFAHELSEVMGRVTVDGYYDPSVSASVYAPLDLFHYSAPGIRTFSGTAAGYFSYDGGNTHLTDFNTNPSGDFGDWASNSGNDAFGAFLPIGVKGNITSTDLQVLDVLGYTLRSQPPAMIEAYGTTTLAQAAKQFYLQDGTGPQQILRYDGVNVIAGQFDAWTPIGAEATGNGYEVAWKFGNADQYIVWTTDSNGNYLASPIHIVPGSDAALQSAEILFQQDLNGDGHLGLAPLAIEANGTTTLVRAGNQFYLQDNAGAGPVLKYQGANVVAGQFGDWTPIGAEIIGNGYEVAWKAGSTDQYIVWTTDANGNYLASPIHIVPGSDSALQSAETLFHQDLNGDGQIGVPVATPIESNGATTLATAANLFYLQDNTGSGPVLQYQGANVVAGEFGDWTPIGAEATGNGYEIVWKFGSADQYIVWTADVNGNYLSSPIHIVPGSDPALESAETLFQQDLNGDGHVGVFRLPIEANGTTTLATAANQFYLDDSTGAGPVLKYQGTNVTAGEFGAWTPISAETTGNGYEVAWKLGNADQYIVWTTDANGNYLASPIHIVPGSDSALESAETLFQQDLNGDGQIGGNGQIGVPVTTPIETNGATKLGTADNQFYLQDSTGVGPVLKYQGTNVTAGEFGAWTPIGAEVTGNGYEVAWKFGSADQYIVWTTDANGNYLASPIHIVPGSDPALESAETLFQQDLNGDGHFGLF
jgi:cytochrome c2